MSNPIWDGIEIDWDALQNYGWYTSRITVGGETYPLWVGYQVAGLREMDSKLAEADTIAAAGGAAVPSIRYTWDTGTTDADPGTGDVRANHATLASATEIYVSTTDAGSADVSAILATWDDSTSSTKGMLRIAHRTDPTKWVEYAVTGAITSASGYRKIPVTYVGGPGGFTAADAVALGVSRTGDKGEKGDTGSLGARDRTARTSGFTVTSEMAGTLQDCTSGSFTVAFDPAATLGDGFAVLIRNSGAGTITLDPDGSETINGAASMTLGPNTTVEVMSDGSNLKVISGGAPLASTSEAEAGTDATKAVTPAGLAAATLMQGKHSIWVPAHAMISRTTNGAGSGSAETPTNKVMIKSLDFDTSTQEHAQFSVSMPKSWNEGTITFRPRWTAASGSGGVVWAMRAVAVGDDDALDAAFGTAQTSTDTLITANDEHRGPESSAITVAGTPAEGDRVICEIYRDVGNGSDTLAVDAKLLGVDVYYTVNAATDA